MAKKRNLMGVFGALLIFASTMSGCGEVGGYDNGGVSSSLGISSSSDISSSSEDASSSSDTITNPNDSVAYGGQTYRTVKIGEQVWFAENLNYNASGSICYDERQANCAKYGRLYDWSTAMGLPSSCNSNTCSSQIQSRHKGICPDGWHIPSNADWANLLNFVDSENNGYGAEEAGRYLKATSGWNSYDAVVSGNGIDKYGFSALPGGWYSSSYANFNYIGENGYWWNTYEYSSYLAYYHYMFYRYEYARWFYNAKSGLLSVRCIKD